MNGKLLGFMAIDQYGQIEHLRNPEHPRKQLLERLGLKHCAKMYCDLKGGGARHKGYVVGGRWFTLYEVHAWNGHAEKAAN